MSLPVNIWRTHQPMATQRLPDVFHESISHHAECVYDCENDCFVSLSSGTGGGQGATRRSMHLEELRLVRGSEVFHTPQDLHFLSEHVDADTAPLSVSVLRETLRGKSTPGVCMSYFL